MDEDKTAQRGRKVPWTDEEDLKLMSTVNQLYGNPSETKIDWNCVKRRLPERTTAQLRERYMNVLNPKTNRTPLTEPEMEKLLHLQHQCGNKWKFISVQFQGRTALILKNAFFSLLRRYRREHLREPQGLDLLKFYKDINRCPARKRRKLGDDVQTDSSVDSPRSSGGERQKNGELSASLSSNRDTSPSNTSKRMRQAPSSVSFGQTTLENPQTACVLEENPKHVQRRSRWQNIADLKTTINSFPQKIDTEAPLKSLKTVNQDMNLPSSMPCFRSFSAPMPVDELSVMGDIDSVGSHDPFHFPQYEAAGTEELFASNSDAETSNWALSVSDRYSGDVSNKDDWDRCSFDEQLLEDASPS